MQRRIRKISEAVLHGVKCVLGRVGCYWKVYTYGQLERFATEQRQAVADRLRKIGVSKTVIDQVEVTLRAKQERVVIAMTGVPIPKMNMPLVPVISGRMVDPREQVGSLNGKGGFNALLTSAQLLVRTEAPAIAYWMTDVSAGKEHANKSPAQAWADIRRQNRFGLFAEGCTSLCSCGVRPPKDGKFWCSATFHISEQATVSLGFDIAGSGVLMLEQHPSETVRSNWWTPSCARFI